MCIVNLYSPNERFGQDGGYKRFDAMMEGELVKVITEVKTGLWEQS